MPTAFSETARWARGARHQARIRATRWLSPPRAKPCIRPTPTRLLSITLLTLPGFARANANIAIAVVLIAGGGLIAARTWSGRLDFDGVSVRNRLRGCPSLVLPIRLWLAYPSGRRYFEEMAELINVPGKPDGAKLREIMMRHGLVPA